MAACPRRQRHSLLRNGSKARRGLRTIAPWKRGLLFASVDRSIGSSVDNKLARISIMARSKSSTNRPDTLAQDQPRHPESLLRRTAGPYIGSRRLLGRKMARARVLNYDELIRFWLLWRGPKNNTATERLVRTEFLWELKDVSVQCRQEKEATGNHHPS